MQEVYFVSLVCSFTSDGGVIGPRVRSFFIVSCDRCSPVAPGQDFPREPTLSNRASPVCFPTWPVGNHAGSPNACGVRGGRRLGARKAPVWVSRAQHGPLLGPCPVAARLFPTLVDGGREEQVWSDIVGVIDYRRSRQSHQQSQRVRASRKDRLGARTIAERASRPASWLSHPTPSYYAGSLRTRTRVPDTIVLREASGVPRAGPNLSRRHRTRRPGS